MKGEKMFKTIITVFAVLLWCGPVFGAHPMITDDSGTQGAGKFQIELNGEYAKDSSDSTTEIAVAVAGGVRDNLDIVLAVPYQFLRFNDDESNRITEDGISDIAIELKWRFYENEDVSLALKPGIIIPSGDDAKGLGDGKASYGLVLITTKEIDPATLHFNLGFNKNRKELRDIWHYSFAAEYELMENILLVGNIGGETNPDKESDTHPAFILGGLIYSVNENFNVDAGIKAALNNAEPDYTILAGLTVVFGRIK
jgi:hypothetical protein